MCDRVKACLSEREALREERGSLPKGDHGKPEVIVRYVSEHNALNEALSRIQAEHTIARKEMEELRSKESRDVDLVAQKPDECLVLMAECVRFLGDDQRLAEALGKTSLNVQWIFVENQQLQQQVEEIKTRLYDLASPTFLKRHPKHSSTQ